MNLRSWILVLMLALPLIPAHAGNDGAKTIVQTAMAAGNFNTLTKALQAAELVDTLQGPGPFTVFAPTDAAFNKLPAGALDGLLKDPEKLKQVLLYHIVPGKVPAAEVVKLSNSKNCAGFRSPDPVRIGWSNSGWRQSG